MHRLDDRSTCTFVLLVHQQGPQDSRGHRPVRAVARRCGGTCERVPASDTRCILGKICEALLPRYLKVQILRLEELLAGATHNTPGLRLRRGSLVARWRGDAEPLEPKQGHVSGQHVSKCPRHPIAYYELGVRRSTFIQPFNATGRLLDGPFRTAEKAVATSP